MPWWRVRGHRPAFSFHHVNAFEADGRVHVDLLAYPDAGVIDRLRLAPLRAGEPADATALLTRFAVPLGDDGDEPAEIAGRVLCDEPVELPRFDYARRARAGPIRCCGRVGAERRRELLGHDRPHRPVGSRGIGAPLAGAGLLSR